MTPTKEKWRLTWKDPEVIVTAAVFLLAISPVVGAILVVWVFR